MTIFAHDVQQRPKDFEVALQENLMDLSMDIRLRDKRTGEVQFVKLSQEDPMMAFFVAVWAKAEELSVDSYTYDDYALRKRIEQYNEKLRQKDSLIQQLDRQLEELRSESKKPLPEDEYAYVEGWDEF